MQRKHGMLEQMGFPTLESGLEVLRIPRGVCDLAVVELDFRTYVFTYPARGFSLKACSSGTTRPILSNSPVLSLADSHLSLLDKILWTMMSLFLQLL